ncbi:hypothetical protein [Paenibacillus tyrfis]|uniref:hypothetical protein n=1 Tax=Paenibacillus tyrfis TaxID=1501230 RepID=UPI000B588D86|nr:hypothetical protein [Paenibacillus tyrfis]
MNNEKFTMGNPNLVNINTPLNQRLNNESLRVLSEDDWKFWKDNGYVIIQNAIPEEYINRTRDLIWAFEEKDPVEPSTCIPLRAVKSR